MSLTSSLEDYIEAVFDRYGRKVPKHAHGTANLEKKRPLLD